MAEENLKKYGVVMELYNAFVDFLDHASAKYDQQVPTFHQLIITQLREQGKLPPKISSYDQLSPEQMQLVDAALDEHFAALDPTLPLALETYKFLDAIVELERELLEYWQPIINKSKAFERNGELSPTEFAQVEQFRKRIRRQSVELLNRINSNMLQVARSCKDADMVAAARSYLILHDRLVNVYAKSRMVLVNDRNLSFVND